MQVIENWADVTAHVTATRPHPQLAGYICATLEVLEVKPVAGFANLFDSAKGQTIEVNVPTAAMPHVAIGGATSTSWRIRKAGPNTNFVAPEKQAD